MNEFGSKVAVVKEEPSNFITSERISFVAERIKTLKAEYESSKQMSMLMECYALGCSPSTPENCYSPVCAHTYRLKQELNTLLKEILAARVTAVSMIQEISAIVNGPKRELESDTSPSSNKRFKFNCDDSPTSTPISSRRISNQNSGRSKSKSRRLSVASPRFSTSTKESAKWCIKQRCASILNSESLHDVTFIIGQGEQKEVIHAHKLILSIGSDIFKAMFFENWSSTSAETIEVPDVKPPAFLALLKFLYIDEVSVTPDTIDILYAAKKYSVRPLEDHCVNILIKNLCPGNAFQMLYYGRQFYEQRLIDASLEAIDLDTDAAVLTSDFCDIPSGLLCMVLERDSLTIEEIKLFKAVLRWSEAECGRKSLLVNQENQKFVLKDLLPLVRFPLMSIEDFSSTVTSTDLLTNEELLSVHQYLSKHPKLPIPFNSSPRLWTKFKVNRFKKVDCPYNCDSDSIQFNVDHDVHILGIGLYGSLCGAADYSVKVFLKAPPAKGHILDETIACRYDGSSLTYEVMFKNPLKLTAGTDYAIHLKVLGPDSFYGKSGMKKVTVDLPRNRTVTVNFSARGDKSKSPRSDVTVGQIPELILNVHNADRLMSLCEKIYERP